MENAPAADLLTDIGIGELPSLRPGRYVILSFFVVNAEVASNGRPATQEVPVAMLRHPFGARYMVLERPAGAETTSAQRVHHAGRKSGSLLRGPGPSHLRPKYPWWMRTPQGRLACAAFRYHYLLPPESREVAPYARLHPDDDR